ncbi:PAS domain S-box protein [Magnetospirillum fulvum]|uniref:histidine kinase n=1 Tax=Magnetospirillum fulvum MGU-K5 TaxID=1316936 RepID=S9TNY5_MAGFU|nr:PAS domain S-box protein [Magnetospirillum fulvum]EPY00320.1 PAS domain S-box [Magnetospirillum fulvum MGU-K5]
MIDTHLKGNFIWQVLLGTVLVVLLVFVLGYLEFDRERSHLEENLLLTVTALSRAVDIELETVRTGTAMFASSNRDLIDRRDFATLQSNLSKAAAKGRLINHFALIDRSGQQWVNTLIPYGSKLPVTKNIDKFRPAFETGQPSISPLSVGTISGQNEIFLSIPIQEQGKTVYVFTSIISADSLANILTSLQIPAAWLGNIFDSQGTMIARTRDPDKFVGKMVSARLVKQLERQSSGVFENVNLDNTVTISAYYRSPSTGFGVNIGVPKSLVIWQALEAQWLPGLVAALAVFSLLMAWHSGLALRQQRESEERFRASFSNAAIGFALTNVNGRFLDANPAYCAITGYSLAELRDFAFPQLIHPDDRAENAALTQHLVAGEIFDFIQENRFVRKDGTTVWVRESASLVRGDNLYPRWIVVLLEDITDRRLAEDERHRLAEALRQAAQPMVLTDIDARIVYVNPALQSLFGFAEDAVLGIQIWDFARPEGKVDRQTPAVARDIAAHGRWSGERLCVARDGTEIPVFVTVAGIDNQLGQRTGYIASYLDIAAQKKIQNDLEKERGLLSTLVHTIPDLVWLKDADGVYLSCNSAFEHFVGRSEADIVGCTDYDLVPKDLADFFRANDRKAIAIGTSTTNEEWITFAESGHSALIETIKTPMTNADGGVIGVLGIGRDITERERNRRAIEEAKATLEAALGAMSDAVFISDRQGQFIHLNEAFATFHRFADRNECARSLADYPTILEVTFPDGTPLPLEQWAIPRALRGERASDQEYLLRRKDSGVSWVGSFNFAPIRDRDGEIVGSVVVGRDITDKKQLENELERYRHHLEQVVAERTSELKATEARVRLILQSTADGIIGVDPHGTITFVNPGACRALGYDADQLIGTDSHAILYDSPADDRPFSQENCPVKWTLEAGTIHRVEDDVFRTADGRPLAVSTSVHPMILDDTIVGAVISFTDISSRKANEEARETALAEAERLAVLRREFLANMSHEIRTPLHAILGLAQIGDRQNVGRAEREVFTRILDAGHGLQAVIDDILDFSKIESGKLIIENIPIEIGEVVDRAVDLLALRAQAKSLRFHVREAADIPSRCLGDPNRLRQILVNLLSNAVKFTPSGGEVTLSVARVDETLIFRVVDTGIGIAPDVVDHLFNPFVQADGSTTRRYGGTGLGLAISRDLVTRMGGEIAIASTPGQGSTFTVSLPLAGVNEAPPWPDGDIAVFGLSEDDIDVLRAAEPLGRVIADPAQVDDTAFVLVDRDVIEGAATRAAINTRIGEGRGAILVPVGGTDMPHSLGLEVPVIERPLRARHLKRLMIEPHAGRRVLTAGGARLTGLRILAAEDNEVNRLVLEDMLRSEGAILSCFENGRVALDHLHQHGRSAFDIVLTDVQMPEMGGYDFTRAVRDFAPDLPVIGLTADAMEEERERCVAAGMVERMIKPIMVDALATAIQRHLSQRRTSTVDAPPLPLIAEIDRAQLMAQYDGRSAFVKRLAATVISSQGEMATELRSAAASGDFTRVAALAHSIKGTAGNVSAPRILEIAARIEGLFRQGEAVPLDLVEALAMAMTNLLRDLADFKDELD